MITIPVILTLLVLGTTASLVSLVAYAWRNKWWRSNFGRATVTLSFGFAIYLGYATLRLVFHWPINELAQVVEFGVIVLILIQNAVASVLERRRWKRKP
jgi:hypothetical protein